MRIMKRIYFILSFVCMAFFWGHACFGATSPQEAVPRISKEELKARLGSPDLVVIDLWKKVADAGRGRIRGAIRERPIELQAWAVKYRKEKTLVLYCSCEDDEASLRIGRKLIKMGFRHVYALQGGWNEWFQAGYPTEK